VAALQVQSPEFKPQSTNKKQTNWERPSIFLGKYLVLTFLPFSFPPSLASLPSLEMEHSALHKLDKHSELCPTAK
jgi:hypothetical protein